MSCHPSVQVPRALFEQGQEIGGGKRQTHVEAADGVKSGQDKAQDMRQMHGGDEDVGGLANSIGKPFVASCWCGEKVGALEHRHVGVRFCEVWWSA